MLTQVKERKVGKYVNTKHVESLISNYKKERWVDNSKKIGKEDSLSAWYTVDELAEFLQTAKKHGADGIKIYFGVYTKETAKDLRYEDRQTVVLVATKDKLTEAGIPYHKSIHVKTEEGTQILAYNLSNICPPICGSNGGGGFDWENLGTAFIDSPDGMQVI